MTIKAKLLWLAAGVVAALTAMTGLVFFQSRNILNDQVNSVGLETATSCAREVDQFFDKIETIVLGAREAALLVREGRQTPSDDDYQAALPAGNVADGSRIYRHRRLLAADRGVSYEIATTDDLAGGSWIPADIGMDLLDLGAAPMGDGLTETIAYQVSEERLPSPRHLRLKVTVDE